ncbi:unnamed protein product, partial [Polarella glacialis]
MSVPAALFGFKFVGVGLASGPGRFRMESPGRERVQPGVYGGPQAGHAVLQDLLRRPPAEVAAWALEQAGSLSKVGVNLEQLPIFQVAGALNAVPLESKQALIHSAIAGFSQLPAPKRAEAVRLAMQTTSIVQKAEGLELQHRMAMEHTAALNRLANLDRSDARSRRSTQAPPPDLRTTSALTDAPPLVQNFLRVIKEARFEQMPPAEMTCLAQDVQKEVVHLAQPQQLLDVVSELEPEEREQLTKALIDSKIVTE